MFRPPRRAWCPRRAAPQRVCRGRDAAASGDDRPRRRRRAFFVDQRLPIGDRDLVVIRMNFAESEEAVAVAAVIDERGLQRRLNARHFRQINIAS
jgi:hypothetical protein